MTRFHLINGERVAYTAEEETARDIEEAAEKSYQAANGYKEDRANKYPSVVDQLDMQYWDQVNGTTTWRDAIAKVKSDNPKS
tara:strand:- start:1043 stop:1288 length:246 start_codon:yes stop_codon:yes gene_type:complete